MISLKEKTKKILAYSVLFTAALAYYILAVFVFQSPDGIIGYLLCMASLCTVFASVIRLYQLTSGKGFAEAVIDTIIIALFG